MASESIPLKQCSRKEQCLHPDGPWLPATAEYFMPHKGKLYSQCHVCRREAKRQSHIRNREHNIERSRRWDEANKDRVNAERREQYRDNPTPAIERAKAYYRRNTEARKTYISQWQHSNPDKMRLYRRQHYERTKDAKLAYTRRWRRANPDKRRQYEQSYRERNPLKAHSKRARIHARRRMREQTAAGHFTAADISGLYEDQQGLCAYCGIRLFDNYHIDHVLPISRGGSNSTENLLLSCPKCNQGKSDKTLAEWQAIRGW